MSPPHTSLRTSLTSATKETYRSKTRRSVTTGFMRVNSTKSTTRCALTSASRLIDRPSSTSAVRHSQRSRHLSRPLRLSRNKTMLIETHRSCYKRRNPRYTCLKYWKDSRSQCKIIRSKWGTDCIEDSTIKSSLALILSLETPARSIHIRMSNRRCLTLRAAYLVRMVAVIWMPWGRPPSRQACWCGLIRSSRICSWLCLRVKC